MEVVNMEELIQDLTCALEETSKSKEDLEPEGEVEGACAASPCQIRRRQARKRRGRKRRSDPNPIWEYGNISEASESSLDEALKDYMENVTQQQEDDHDSDDLIMAKRLLSLNFNSTASNRHSFHSESDTFTDSYSKVRSARPSRRRKYKRMAVDPQGTVGSPMTPQLPDGLPDYIPRKRKQLKKGGKGLLKEGSQDEDAMDIEGLRSGQFGYDIKKLRMKDSQIDQARTAGEHDSMDCYDEGGTSKEGDAESVFESDLSGSESDSGLYTNDEGREGDDEQSDFFHEGVGPACGIPGVIQWWEEDKIDCDDHDPKFDQILNGSLPFLTEVPRGLQARTSRLLGRYSNKRNIKSACRRLKDRKKRGPMYSTNNDMMSGDFSAYQEIWLQPRKKKEKDQSLSSHHHLLYSYGQPGHHKCGSADNKRRRKIPQSSPMAQGYVGENADPIPDNNVGNRMLRGMGWSPGLGLGAENQGMTQPVRAFLRPKRISSWGLKLMQLVSPVQTWVLHGTQDCRHECSSQHPSQMITLCILMQSWPQTP
ncbi:G patch domain-containing protein 2-like [Branchiostoma floridae]|uniref:G patch domain-containing protein 2-like n=1 Tax=Branchiostoma floridae TaxID=7739 RepID=A0A9J7LZ00_BRAFL|nr:G patch domain-containing protein 2-like [Branchiostoma floridae]